MRSPPQLQGPSRALFALRCTFVSSWTMYNEVASSKTAKMGTRWGWEMRERISSCLRTARSCVAFSLNLRTRCGRGRGQDPIAGVHRAYQINGGCSQTGPRSP